MDKYSSIVNKAHLLHSNPHAVLGIKDDRTIVQYRPGSDSAEIILFDQRTPLERIDNCGLFAIEVKEILTPTDYKVIHQDGTVAYDPYVFSNIVSFKESPDFTKVHSNLHTILGAHREVVEAIEGTRFSVYAPNAKSVYLACDLGLWNESSYPMRKICKQGIYELFVPGCKKEINYKFLIVDQSGQKHLKSDPYAKKFELRPKTASVVYTESEFNWQDQSYLQNRKKCCEHRPLNIYEMHVHAWAKGESFPNFRELAKEVCEYVQEMGYTHVELLPIKEHPLDESWGYQVIGYFSPTSRYGTTTDFQYFVNYLHMHGIGVILDFVPAHFPEDPSFLASFDGNPLFESKDPNARKHPQWTTMLFDFSSSYVRSFLLSAITYWIKHMHIDGIRVDAVASILYYQKDEGGEHKVFNKEGGVENLDGFAFLREVNSHLDRHYPDVLKIAEDESYFGKTTQAISNGGLGFDLKWNIGWAQDVLDFLLYSDEKKCNEIRFLLKYFKEAFKEKYLLILSHDNVSNGEGSLLQKFPGSIEEKYRYLRLLYSYAITHPGKKLFFMGHEVGEKEEFTPKTSWRKKGKLEKCQEHHLIFTKELNELYKSCAPLHQFDFDERGFSWIDYSTHKYPVISYIRKATQETLLVIHNFSKRDVLRKFIAIPGVKRMEIFFHSEEKKYGGKITHKPGFSIESNALGVYLDLTKFSTIICKVVIDEGCNF